MGCHTEPAVVHIAHVLQRLHFFQFFNFLYNLDDLPQIKITHICCKKHYRLDDFFVHDLHFSRIRLLAWCYLYLLRALVSATLWAVLPFWHCSVSGTPSLSYMICPDLVQCVSFPPWQT